MSAANLPKIVWIPVLALALLGFVTVLLAKGYDEAAQKIKALAAEHDIPMVENVPLARALAREVQIGQPIKAKWFKPVAEILAAVYRPRKGAAWRADNQGRSIHVVQSDLSIPSAVALGNAARRLASVQIAGFLIVPT